MDKNLKVVVYGDSITTGCNSSGTDLGGNVPPYADSFPVMIQKKLQNIYEATVGVRNVAVGGWSTVNGRDAAEKRYRDMTGNNINHPNDFIARVYAQVILKRLLG